MFTAYIAAGTEVVVLYYPPPRFPVPTQSMAQVEEELARALVDLKRPPKKRRHRSPHVRFWFFTDNGIAGLKGEGLIGENWKELPAGVTYLSWQLEKGQETGHPHLQGHLELSTAQYVSWLHKHVSHTASFEVRRGTAAQCDVYCSKEEGALEGPYHLGKPSNGAGARTDLEAVRDAIKSGINIRDLAMDHLPVLARYPRLISTLTTLYRPKWVEGGQRVKVYLLIGKTRCGKTKAVYKRWSHKDSFYEMPIATTSLWWDGFDQHTNILMDDFCGAASHMRLDTLLKILDSYPRRVPVKGSFAWYQPKAVAITTNIHPRKWYDYSDREEQYDALAARFYKVMKYNERKQDMERMGSEFWEVEDREDKNTKTECCHACNYCNIEKHKTKKRKRW